MKRTKEQKKKIRNKFLIALGIIIFLFFYVLVNINTIENQQETKIVNQVKEKDNFQIEQKSIIEKKENCGEEIPEEIEINIQPAMNFIWKRTLVNCHYNSEVGQKASEFRCTMFSKSIGQVSEEGIILRDYEIQHELVFEDEDCEFYERDLKKYKKCKFKESYCNKRYL